MSSDSTRRVAPVVAAALAALAAGLALLAPADAAAQQPTRRPARRAAPAIEIRGQVPTPQVVTVRPREVPAYDRQVLVPGYYDHDFWPSIVPGYQLVPRSAVVGVMPGDSSWAGSTAPRPMAAPTTGAPAAAPPAPPAAPATPAAPPPAPADSTRRVPRGEGPRQGEGGAAQPGTTTPGTAPAR